MQHNNDNVHSVRYANEKCEFDIRIFPYCEGKYFTYTLKMKRHYFDHAFATFTSEDECFDSIHEAVIASLYKLLSKIVFFISNKKSMQREIQKILFEYKQYKIF